MKGQLNVATPKQYLEALVEPRKSDVAALDALIRKTVPKLESFIMSGMLAYGRTRYKYPDGREMDWCRIAMASNASYISLYVGDVAARYKDALPKANIGKGCVRFKRVSDLDQTALKKLIRDGAR